jgi:glycosyltransferase involved in cell wall biosynthesis
MISNPIFSIIVPTYNSEKNIEGCLDSILSQTFNNYEVLIIDSCSNDNTKRIVEQLMLANTSIRFLQERDNGIYDAMNKGLVAAHGDWLYFLGSDDRLNSANVLEQVSEKIKKDDTTSVVYGNVRIKGDTSWAKDGDIYDGRFTLDKLLKKNICHQSIFYKRLFINAAIGNYNVNYKLCADWDFNLRCWAHKPFHFADIIIADFFGGGTTTIEHIDDNFSKDFKQIIWRLFTEKQLQQTSFNKPQVLLFSSLRRKVKAIWNNSF